MCHSVERHGMKACYNRVPVEMYAVCEMILFVSHSLALVPILLLSVIHCNLQFYADDIMFIVRCCTSSALIYGHLYMHLYTKYTLITLTINLCHQGYYFYSTTS